MEISDVCIGFYVPPWAALCECKVTYFLPPLKGHQNISPEKFLPLVMNWLLLHQKRSKFWNDARLIYVATSENFRCTSKSLWKMRPVILLEDRLTCNDSSSLGHAFDKLMRLSSGDLLDRSPWFIRRILSRDEKFLCGLENAHQVWYALINVGIL